MSDPDPYPLYQAQQGSILLSTNPDLYVTQTLYYQTIFTLLGLAGITVFRAIDLASPW